MRPVKNTCSAGQRCCSHDPRYEFTHAISVNLNANNPLPQTLPSYNTSTGAAIGAFRHGQREF